MQLIDLFFEGSRQCNQLVSDELDAGGGLQSRLQLCLFDVIDCNFWLPYLLL